MSVDGQDYFDLLLLYGQVGLLLVDLKHRVLLVLLLVPFLVLTDVHKARMLVVG